MEMEDEGRYEILVDMAVICEVKKMKKMKMELGEFVRGERKWKWKWDDDSLKMKLVGIK